MRHPRRIRTRNEIRRDRYRWKLVGIELRKAIADGLALSTALFTGELREYMGVRFFA